MCRQSSTGLLKVNYWETFSPAVQWVTVWLLLIPASVENLHTCHVDFVLAFSQADLDVLIYMQLPQWVNNDSKTHVLLLRKLSTESNKPVPCGLKNCDSAFNSRVLFNPKLTPAAS